MTKKTLFLIVVGMISFVPPTQAQTEKVSITVQNASLKDVLREIEKQTDYLFVYSPTEVDVSRKTTLQATDKAVKDVLTAVFNQTDIAYLMEGSSILLMKRPAVGQQSGSKNISGTVVDATGEPIIGASVSVKGANIGTTTDIDGKFSLAADPKAALVVSYLGYKAQEIAGGGGTAFEHFAA